MAKPNYNYEKRAREIEKQKKKEEKRKKKEARNSNETVDEVEKSSGISTDKE